MKCKGLVIFDGKNKYISYLIFHFEAAFLKIIVHETDTGPFYKYVTRWDEFVLPFVTTPRPNVLHTDLFGRTFRRTR